MQKVRLQAQVVALYMGNGHLQAVCDSIFWQAMRWLLMAAAEDGPSDLIVLTNHLCVLDFRVEVSHILNICNNDCHGACNSHTTSGC